MDTIRKHSKKRDAILNCLRETDAHPSAEWVYSRLKPQIPDLSLGTVYRNLALFKETGEAISLGTVMGLERFDGRTDPHIHFVCTRCGRILDLPGIQVPPCLTEQAGKILGAPVEVTRLTFYGACAQRAANRAAEEKLQNLSYDQKDPI